MKTFVTVIIVIGAIAFGAFNYHFILTDNSIKILKKVELTLDSTFVDARGVQRIKLYTNMALVKAGIKDLFEDDGFTIEKKGSHSEKKQRE
jgi:hypothetical protein